MIVRAILMIAVIAISFGAGVFYTTPDGQKFVADAKKAAESLTDGDAGDEPAEAKSGPAAEEDIANQRAALAVAADGAGFGPQSPRDLSTREGNNARVFAQAPAYTEMNLCNIHFHEGAEHRGGRFTTYAGPGNGKGYGTGFLFDGILSPAEATPLDAEIGDKGYGGLQSGDTIEIHFVHSTADITPGPTLGACISESIGNPQLRVETVVAVLVNDPNAADMTEIAALSQVDGYHQAANLPNNLGTPVAYLGSTTGPSFNQVGSPFQVSWSVRPEVLKLDISSVGVWFADNVFNEDHAHGVRNLVINPELLSTIGQ